MKAHKTDSVRFIGWILRNVTNIFYSFQIYCCLGRNKIVHPVPAFPGGLNFSATLIG